MRKKDEDKTYGQKLIALFSDLYFTGQKRSLIELADKLNCSKQTVQRLIDNITQGYAAPIAQTKEGRRVYYQIIRPERLPRNLSMSPEELSLLYMCMGFTKHLLGRELLEVTQRAIQKSCTLVEGGVKGDHFSAFIPGTIDYTPRKDDLPLLVRAMEEKRVCKIVYKKPMAERGKTFYIKPYKLFSYNNALYLHAGLARTPGKPVSSVAFNPLLAVHRLKKVALTERKFVFPENYNFEEHFNQEFGVIKQDAFTVKLELTGYAAVYARERQLSPDQKIQKKKKSLILTFTASSAPEVIAWILSLGGDARVLSPDWLAEEVRQAAVDIVGHYQ